jgi:integrase/recombinase XerD
MMTYQQAMRKLYTDMQLRGFSERTIDCYILGVKRFLNQTTKPNINALNEADFRSFLMALHQQDDLKASTINHYNSIIRFFYEVTLEKNINYKRIPHSKVHKSKPEVLSPDELLILFDEITNLKHFAFFINLYGSGLRISEMASLKTQDILKSKMLLHVSDGKGGKERFAPLTDAGYWALQQYWKRYRPKNARNYVFPDCTRTRSMSSAAFDSTIRKISNKSSLSKSVSAHALRHSFSTHMLQSGTDLMTLKEMLGHSSLSSTAIYLHLSLIDTSTKRSPADVSAEIQDRFAERMFFHA